MTSPCELANDLVSEGDRLRDAGDLEAAVAIYEKIALTTDSAAVGYFKLGTAFSRMNREEDAVSAYQKAIELRQDYPEPVNNLAMIHSARGEFEQAELLYRGLLADWPDHFESQINFGNLMLDTGRPGEAQFYFRRAVSLRPDSALAHERLGSVLRNRGRIREAVTEFKKALELDDRSHTAWNGLGTCCFDLGAHSDADRAFTQSIDLHPHAIAWHNWLFVPNFQSETRESVFARHKRYGEHLRTVCGPLRYRYSHRSYAPERRLRVGFVSGDLRRHSVAYFLLSAVSKLDKNEFELWAYSTYRADDEMSDRLRPNFWRWKDLVGLSDSAAAGQIHADSVDVLFDLSGHTNHNRLGLFGFKPAPVQVSWLGYPNTTGLDCMDYRITDELADPNADDSLYYTEKLVRLPGPFLCYTPPEDSPAIVPPPSGGNSCVTFGSFNARVKIGDECVALWSRVLQAVPGSRLLIKSYSGFDEDASRQELLLKFAGHGVDAGRIRMIGAKTSLAEHLGTYGEVDIALDTFPYNGTTTTCEALWMGVPVITLAGDRHASRVGQDLLTRVELEMLVANSPDQFVSLAVALAADVARLHSLRSGMRERLQASPLMDSAAMGRNLANAIRDMWRSFCSREDSQPRIHSVAPGQLPPASTRLHIGGWQARAGWKILNALDGPDVDFVGDIRNLQDFSDDCCLEIYASHVLEHVSQSDIIPTLTGFHRLLAPGGKLYLSVPDLQTLSWLLNRPHQQAAQAFLIMRMIFGAQVNRFDFHFIGLTFDFMVEYLRAAGFFSVEQVSSFGLFDDTSELQFDGIPISLNLLIEK